MDPSMKPCPVDLAVYEPFKSAIFTPSEEDAEFCLGDIDRIGKEWVESRDQFILSLLPKSGLLSAIIVDSSQLRPLAIPLFRGVNPDSCSTLDEVCQWRCTANEEVPEHLESSVDLSLLPSLKALTCERPCERPWLWDCKRIELDVQVCQVVKKTVSLFGLDPSTATVPQVRGCRQRYNCIRCQNPAWGLGGRDMDWHAVVRFPFPHTSPLQPKLTTRLMLRYIMN